MLELGHINDGVTDKKSMNTTEVLKAAVFLLCLLATGD